MELINDKFKKLCTIKSDINEHLITLKKYSEECNTVLELGVRGCVSSWAFVHGLLKSHKNGDKKIILNDIRECNIKELLDATQNLDIKVEYVWKNDLELKLEENVDLTFIDTWHVYGQLKRELDKFSKITNKYIIMHDTELDKVGGETIRNNWDANEQSKITGIPVNEINLGLENAIKEFLEKNNNWKIKEVFRNNNGLTVLEKITYN